MIITLYTEKGGVGKTTNTIHIGASLAKLGHKVLLIDFDTQCDLTKGCGITNPSYTVKDLLDGTGTVKLRTRSENFTVMPGSPDIISIDYKGDELAKALEAWKAHYSYIIIDCPPQPINPKFVTLPQLALIASDYFIIPLEAGNYAVTNSEKVLNKVIAQIKPKNPSLRFAGYIFGKILSTAKKRNSKYIDHMNSVAPGSVFENTIRQDAEIEYAIDHGMTIFQHRPNCRAAQDFIGFSQELIKRTTNDKK